jgi:hypothetical protein
VLACGLVPAPPSPCRIYICFLSGRRRTGSGRFEAGKGSLSMDFPNVSSSSCTSSLAHHHAIPTGPDRPWQQSRTISHHRTAALLLTDPHDNRIAINTVRRRPADASRGAASFTRRSGRLARRPYGLWSWGFPFIQHQTIPNSGPWDIVAKSFCASLGRRLAAWSI